MFLGVRQPERIILLPIEFLNLFNVSCIFYLMDYKYTNNCFDDQHPFTVHYSCFRVVSIFASLHERRTLAAPSLRKQILDIPTTLRKQHHTTHHERRQHVLPLRLLGIPHSTMTTPTRPLTISRRSPPRPSARAATLSSRLASPLCRSPSSPLKSAQQSTRPSLLRPWCCS